MDEATVDHYLKRIGARRPATPTAAALRDLHRRHLETVPFENLSIHLNEPIDLTEEALTTKIIDRGRGGFCYELNGLFAVLLEALGYRVHRLAASVHTGEGELSPAFDHMALMVELEERYLADVGFGAHTVYPLKLDWPEPQEDPEGTFLVVDGPNGDVDVLKAGEPQYRAEQRPRRLHDFARLAWWHSTSPDSHFRGAPRCSKRTEKGRISIVGNTLIETVGETQTKTTLTAEELPAAYETHFGFTLPRKFTNP